MLTAVVSGVAARRGRIEVNIRCTGPEAGFTLRTLWETGAEERPWVVAIEVLDWLDVVPDPAAGGVGESFIEGAAQEQLLADGDVAHHGGPLGEAGALVEGPGISGEHQMMGRP